jgi:hypothetical protein
MNLAAELHSKTVVNSDVGLFFRLQIVLLSYLETLK